MSEITLQGAIGKVIELLQDAKDESLGELKKAPESGNIMIIVGSGLDTLVSRLSFLGGITVNHAPAVEFPPITNFMGEEIVLKKDIVTEDLTASELERERFLAKVEQLFLEIESISPDGILNNYTLPEDVLVVRGVAKKVGVVDFAEKAMTVQFIEEIVAAKNELAAKQLQEKKIEEQLANEAKIASIGTRMKEVEAKKAELAEELTAAEGEANAATPKDKSKAAAKVKGIQGEIDAANQLLENLSAEIDSLKA